MISFLRRPMLAALFVAAVTSVTVIALEPLYAQYGQTAQAGKAAKGKQAKQDPATTARREVGTPINDALKLVEAKNWDGAMAKVQLADAVKDKTPYEDFMVAKYIAYIAVNREPQDIADRDSGREPADRLERRARGRKGRYVFHGHAPELRGHGLRQGHPERRAAQSDEPAVQRAAEPRPGAGLLQHMDYANAAKAAKEASDQKPSADMLGLLLNSQAKMKDDAGYRVTLDKLATVSAQPEVWGQVMDFALDSVSKGPTDGQEHRLLNVFRLAMLVGTMREPDYPAMASIDLTERLAERGQGSSGQGQPHHGRSGDPDANMLAQTTKASLTALAAEVGKLPNGESEVKLGESYMTYGRHDEAVTALRAGIQKGGLKDLPDAQTTLGIALYKAGKKRGGARGIPQGGNGELAFGRRGSRLGAVPAATSGLTNTQLHAEGAEPMLRALFASLGVCSK